MAEAKKYAPLLSGHEVVPLEGEEEARFSANWKGHSKGMGRLQPGGTMVTLPITLVHDKIMKFKFTPTDVLVMTYPKCGTTWMQEIVWTLRNNPDLDHPMAMAPVNSRCPFMELDSIVTPDNLPPLDSDDPLMQAFRQACPKGDPSKGVFIQLAEAAPQPRTVKTHLPFSLIPKDVLDKSKVVYVIRNPKDVIVSFIHHCRIFKVHNFAGSLEDFVQDFIDGNSLYGHYDRHLREAVARLAHPNLLLVRYEDLKTDAAGQLKIIDQFLATNRTQQQLDKVEHYTSFAEMKKRDNVLDSKKPEVPGLPVQDNPMFNMDVIKRDGGFFRKGEAGGWKESLTPELSAKVDKWMVEKLSDFPAEYRYED